MSKTGKKEKINLTEGSPFRVIMQFTLPVIGGNLFQLFYTLADSVIVGKNPGDVFSGCSRGYKHYRIFCAVLYSGNDKWFWHLPGTESRRGEAGRDQKRELRHLCG